MAGELLRPVPLEHRATLRFTGVCTFVPVLVVPGGNGAPATAPKAEEPTNKKQAALDVEAPQPPMKQSSSRRAFLPEDPAAPKERQVLFNINGCVEPGQILALMGPSGSGKSSLLTVLGGRNAARITGSVRFNDRPLDKAVKRRMGFVTQDDILYAELTTFETLYYAALLRLPKTWSRAQKEERVNMVLSGLGLDKCRDTIIGNNMMRGVSGGERKRVSIGHELLINPSVLLLDEPTSGLDSTTALKLIQTLRALASGGRTIIASIHQPSSRLYTEFDKLMLLSEGHCMFYGDAHASAHWFALQRVPVPFGVSVPDHLLDLACGDLTGDAPRDEAAALRERLVEAFELRRLGVGEGGVLELEFDHGTTAQGVPVATDAAKAAQASSPTATPRRTASSGGLLKTRQSLGASGSSTGDVAGMDKSQAAGDAQDSQEVVDEGKWGATFLQQVSILSSRCMRTRRFQSVSSQRSVELIATAVIAGCFWWQTGAGEPTEESIQNTNGLLFFNALFLSFSAMFVSLFAFPADYSILVKERQSGMYRLSAYYVARTLSDMPVDCLLPTIFQLITYFMGGLRLTAGAYFANWGAIMLTILVSQSVGLLLSASIRHPKTMLSIATVFTLATMLVAGFYVQSVPGWIAWAKYLSYLRYTFILLQKIEFSGRGMSCTDYYKNNPDAPPGMTWCPVSGSGLLPSEINDTAALEVGVLLIWLVVMRVLIYVVLSYRTTFRSKSKY